jgi:16S rRNA processing protein RimM
MMLPRNPPEKPTTPGSPPSGEPVFLAVGKLRRPHGVQGEIQMDVLTDFPERLHPGVTLYLGPEHKPLRLAGCRRHDPALLVRFSGYDTPEAVGELRNLVAYVQAADRPPLPEGEYYHHQLIGLHVVSETGTALGQIKQILETGANDVAVVQPAHGREFLVPLVDAFLVRVDLAAGELVIRLLPGLMDE